MFSLEVISVKSKNFHFFSQEAENENHERTLLSGTFKVSENKVVLLSLFLASTSRY